MTFNTTNVSTTQNACFGLFLAIVSLTSFLSRVVSADESDSRFYAQIAISPSANAEEAAKAREFFQRFGGRSVHGWHGLNAKKLHVVSAELDDQAIQPLRHLVTLEELALVGNSITNQGLKPVGSLENLKSLWLFGSCPDSANITMKIDGHGLQHLHRLGDLEKLMLWNLTDQLETLAPLKHVSNLKHLQFFETVRTIPKPPPSTPRNIDKILASLSETSGLENLWFNANRPTIVTDRAFQNWESAATIRTIQLQGVTITGKGWSQLESFESLEELGYDAGGGLIDWASLSSLAQLRSVRVAGLRDESLQGIAQCGQIRDLNLSGHELTEQSVRHLSGMTQLETLQLTHCKIGGKFIAEIAKTLPNLRNVSFFYTPITDAGLAGLVQLPAIETLDLENTNITPQGMRLLLRAKKTLKLVTPPLPTYLVDPSETPYGDVADEISKEAPEIKFQFHMDIPA